MVEPFALIRETDTAAQLMQSVAEETDGHAPASPMPPTVFARPPAPERRCASSPRGT